MGSHGISSHVGGHKVRLRACHYVGSCILRSSDLGVMRKLQDGLHIAGGDDNAADCWLDHRMGVVPKGYWKPQEQGEVSVLMDGLVGCGANELATYTLTHNLTETPYRSKQVKGASLAPVSTDPLEMSDQV